MAGTHASFESDAVQLRRNGNALEGAAAVVALGVLLVLSAEARAVALGVWVAWLGLGGLLYAWVRNPGGLRQAVHVRADARGVWVDGALSAPAGAIAGGWVQPRGAAPPIVHVRARGLGAGRRWYSFVVEDLRAARAFVDALHVDPARVAADYWALARPLGEPRAFARAGAVLVAALAFGLIAGPGLPPALAVAMVALFVLVVGVAVPTRVTVGADGVLLRWLGTVRFVSWSRVRAVEAFDGGVILALAGGRESWLTLRMPADHERYQPERDAMVERMRAAARAHAADVPGDEGATARLLGRSGGATREWVRAVRAVVSPLSTTIAGLDTWAEGYRTAAVPADPLWRIVEDPRAARTARTGAALAIARTLAAEDEAGRERLLAAAQACAEPRLRLSIALAAVDPDASDDVLADALDALECEGDDDEDAVREVARRTWMA